MKLLPNDKHAASGAIILACLAYCVGVIVLSSALAQWCFAP